MPRTTLSRTQGSACRGWGADLRVQFWDAASNLHSHSYTGVDLSLGRWIKLKAWGLGVTFFFFFLWQLVGLEGWSGQKSAEQEPKR